MKKLLLHVCCAPCAIYFLENLKNYKITLFFYNPNIMPKEEHEKRLNEVKKIAGIYNLKLITEEYDNKLFLEKTKSLEREKEGGKRCQVCYQIRLEKINKYLDDYDYFSTSLVISPYKNKTIIDEISKKINQKYLILELEKNACQESIILSKEYNLYRQNYCGCMYKQKI